jgi:hypothetical protein
MLKNKCCLYVIISIHFFSITICNLLIEVPPYNPTRVVLDYITQHIFISYMYLAEMSFIQGSTQFGFQLEILL